MTLNEHVIVDTTSSTTQDIFYPEDGYALWEDDEETNLNPETGEPLCYWLQIRYPKTWQGNPYSEQRAPHIWAKLIDETMEVFNTGNQTQVMTLSLDDEPAAPVSHTYIDENGVEKPKKGVY